MHYKLVFPRNDKQDELAVEFDANDAAAALIYAHRETTGRSAELWKNDRMLCRIRRVPTAESTIWQIMSATA